MTQATFINLKALSSTREVKFAQRAREEADSARSALQALKTTGESVKTATAPGNSPTLLQGGSRASLKRAFDFEGQIDLTLVDEGRKFFWPAELLRCPRCGNKPALEADWEPVSKKPRYRVHCSYTRAVPSMNTFPNDECDQTVGDWHDSNRDAIRCWNLAVKLAQ